jgi:hypothetical protein
MDLMEKIVQERSHLRIMNYWLIEFFDAQTRATLKVHSDEFAKKYI